MRTLQAYRRNQNPRHVRERGMTVLELIVASGVGAIVLTILWLLTVFAFRSFAALGNYAELDGTSRRALDLMGYEIRQATHVVGIQNSGNLRWLTVANTNAMVTNTYTWDAGTAVMTWDRWEGGTHLSRTNLTGCDMWTIDMYTRAPKTNDGTFNLTSDPKLCKLINMQWKCSRSILGEKVNTETVLTAQLVLRNKQSK